VPILNARNQDVVLKKGTLLGKVFVTRTMTTGQLQRVRRVRTEETISPAYAEVIEKMVKDLPSELT